MSPSAAAKGVKQYMLLLSTTDKEWSKNNAASMTRLYALYKQSTIGPAKETKVLNNTTVVTERTEEMLEAWVALGPMESLTAKKDFVNELSYVVPSWDYSQFNGHQNPDVPSASSK